MKQNQLLISVVTLGLIVSSSSTRVLAQGNLVLNGGFDTGTNGWAEMNMNGSGWGPDKGNPGGFVDLDSAPSLPTDPTISQLVNDLVPEQIYLVSGDFEKTINRNGVTNGLSFGVAIDGSFLFETADPVDFQWHSFGFSFTAASSSASLSLSSQRNGTEVSYGIDNISLRNVPEPSPSVLIFLASGVLFYGRRVFR